MKKIAKIFGAIAAVGAAVAGGVALYKKFISPNEDFDDLEDEMEEEFEDEDLDADSSKTADRSYVSLTPSEESTAKEEHAEEETAKPQKAKTLPLRKRLQKQKKKRYKKFPTGRAASDREFFYISFSAFSFASSRSSFSTSACSFFCSRSIRR